MFTDRRYTGRDFDVIKAAMIEYIKSRTKKLTDFSESELAVILVEVVAGVSDMLGFYLDNQALETFLMSARQKKNIMGNLETMNYRLDTIGSAHGEIELEAHITADGSYFIGHIKVPKYTRVVSSQNPVEYFTLEETYLSEEQLKVNIPVMQGIRRLTEVKSSVLKKNYKYYLPKGKITLEGVSIESEGSYWEEVDDAFLEIKGGRKFSVHADADDRVYLMFTHDWRNYLPLDADEKVNISYVISDGTAGIVSELSLNRLIDELKDDVGQNCNGFLTVTNRTKTYGAYDDVDLNLAKANARNSIKTMDRYINIEDYDAGIKRVPWILKTKTCDWRTDPDLVNRPHHVKSWVVTTDGIDVEDIQLKALSEQLYKKGIAGTTIEILPAEWVRFSIDVKFALRGQGDFRAQIRNAVESAILDVFSPKNLVFGDKITYGRVSDIIYQISDAITYVEVDMPEPSYLLNKIQFPYLAGLNLTLVGDDYGKTG